MKNLLPLFIILFYWNCGFAQIVTSPCSHDAIIKRHELYNPDAQQDLNTQQEEIQKNIELLRKGELQKSNSQYVIPVVMHVFHDGDDGKMGMEQALRGLQILNEDFNGLNDGWDSIDPTFDPIKGALDITFCLATIDPDGNPTTGINYYQDPQGMLNEGDLFQHAWDNFKYLNIYFPKYTSGGPSDFTAYAYYPSLIRTNNNLDGIFYSSIRWGYGDHSELTEGQDWASVCAHEAGHWLDLRHTFENGCSGQGDFIDDTPPTTGGTIFLTACNNNDFSCGEQTNGENFMDYNHDCKKMFTLGQIERMTAALYLESRINLWSEQNLLDTGCEEFLTSSSVTSKSNAWRLLPNPSYDGKIFIEEIQGSEKYELYNMMGQLITTGDIQHGEFINISNAGIYFLKIADYSRRVIVL